MSRKIPVGHGVNRTLLDERTPLPTQHRVDVMLANPASLKAIVSKKTDRAGAMVFAYLHLAGLITPSYIPDRTYRQLRNLCRTREKIVT